MREEVIATAAPRSPPPPNPGAEASTAVPGSAIAGGTTELAQVLQPEWKTQKLIDEENAADAWWNEDNAAIDITDTMGGISDTFGT